MPSEKWKTRATIRLNFPSEKILNGVLNAISPEAAKSAGSRSHVTVRAAKSVLTLEIEAKDTSAFRAVVNSYMHWILLVSDTFSRLESIKA